MQNKCINIQSSLMLSGEVERALGVTREFLRYHEDWFEPIRAGGKKIYPTSKVLAVYIKHTQSFPKASPEVIKATEKYIKRTVLDARPQ